MSNFNSLNNSLKPRKKFINHGGDVLTQTELLAILISSGNKKDSVMQLAQGLIEKYNGLENIMELSIEELCLNNGIGQVKAINILVVKHIYEQLLRHPASIKKKIKKPDDVYEMVKYLENKKQEHFVLLCIDNKSRVICSQCLFIGTSDEISIHPREIFNFAIKKLSYGIIIVHNHPSGDLTPSEQDCDSTKRLIEIGNIVGIKVLDHLIISKNGFYSIRKNCDIIF